MATNTRRAIRASIKALTNARNAVLKMSKREEITCDKCGKDIPVWLAKECSAKITIDIPGEPRGCGQRIDLCTECYEKFVDFLEEEVMP